MRGPHLFILPPLASWVAREAAERHDALSQVVQPAGSQPQQTTLHRARGGRGTFSDTSPRPMMRAAFLHRRACGGNLRGIELHHTCTPTARAVLAFTRFEGRHAKSANSAHHLAGSCVAQVITAQAELGNKWSAIAKLLPGRYAPPRHTRGTFPLRSRKGGGGLLSVGALVRAARTTASRTTGTASCARSAACPGGRRTAPRSTRSGRRRAASRASAARWTTRRRSPSPARKVRSPAFFCPRGWWRCERRLGHVCAKHPTQCAPPHRTDTTTRSIRNADLS